MSLDRSTPIQASDLQVVEARDALYRLLKTIVVRNDYNRVCARAGWVINLVFHEGDTVSVRERAWQVFDLFCSVVDPALMVYWHGGMPARLTSKPAQDRIAEKRSKSVEDPKGYAMNFNVASGNPKPPEAWEENAQDYYFVCRIMNEESLWLHDRKLTPGIGPAMSYIRIGLPVSWIEARPLKQSSGWFTTEVVKLMQPFWCTAGWGVIPAIEDRNISSDSKGQQYLYPYLERFPSLEALGTRRLGFHAFNNAMYSVNWLNFVSDPLLDKLGGREAVRAQAQASAFLRVRDVGDCLAIRAGDFPGLGDTHLGHKLPAFGAAARLLKPLRVRELKNNFVAPPPRGDSDEQAYLLACDAYLRRFDDY